MSGIPKEIALSIQHALMKAGYPIGAKVPDGILGKASLASLSKPGVALSLAQCIEKIALPSAMNTHSSLLSREVLNDAISESVSWFLLQSDRRVSPFRSALALQKLSLSEYLLFLCSHEAEQVAGRFNSHSVSPSGLHLGLTQIGLPALQDAASVSRDIPFVKNGDLVSFKKLAFDPVMNLKMALCYAAMNWHYTVNKANSGRISLPKISYQLLYIMHNLGHTVLISLKQGSISSHRYFKGQSEKAKSLFLRHNAANTSALSGKATSVKAEGDKPLDYSVKLGSSRFTLADLTTKPAANSPSKSYSILGQNGAVKASESDVVRNLTLLAEELEVIWQRFPGKLRLNSAFRQGITSSAHEVGLAADITPIASSRSKEGQAVFEALALFVSQRASKYDQVISEMGSARNDVWLHISLGRQDGSIRSEKKFSSGMQTKNGFKLTHSSNLVDLHSMKVIV